MSSLDMLKELFKHMHWADATIWDNVLSIPDVKNNQQLKTLLYHLHITQYAFYHIWSNLSREFPKESDFKTIQKVADWASKYPDLVQSFLAKLKDEDLEKVIHIPWSERLEKVLGRKPAQSNLAETMIQVTAHSSYHRGQVNSRIRALNVDPPMVDFIAWVWLGKPDALWPDVSE
jgi:uncharacterized damage-inducible protein DinB